MVFETVAARVVFAAACELEEGDLHDLLREIRIRLALAEERESAQAIRVARGVAALRECSELLGGKSPSVAKYREQRQAHPEYGWPPDGSVRRWLAPTGGWNEALARARLAAVPPPLATAPSVGPEIQEEEILDAMRQAATDLGKPLEDLSLSAYLRWARDPEVRKRPGRRPASQTPFTRRFGGYRRALAKAIGGEDADTRIAAGAAGHGYAYTDKELLESLDEVVRRACPEGGFPTGAQYDTTRAQILAEEKAAGKPPRAFPNSRVFWRRWRGWATVRFAYEQWKEGRDDTSGEGGS
jgi:hypothetical protein